MGKEQLLLIDMQNDFCHSNGSLFVPSSLADTSHLVDFISKKMQDWHQIFVTMDSHWRYDVAHPLFWLMEDKSPPKPFSAVDWVMFKDGHYQVSNPDDQQRAYDYLLAMHTAHKVHTIWPEHCLVGSWGHQLIDEISTILSDFQNYHHKAPQLVWKGLNPYSEHFSAFSALVPDSCDSTTTFQWDFAQKLLDCDHLYIAGQALSHCVGESLSDLYHHIDNKNLCKNITLLTDCTSAVTGFEQEANAYLQKFQEWGINLITTKEILE